jgi:predicted esterase
MGMPTKLRILCLHGFTSNGAVHAHQARRIIALLHEKYEFLFPDGPHIVPPSDVKDANWHSYVSANSTTGHRAWWFARDSNIARNSSYLPGDQGGYYGIEESLKYLSELIAKDGPVHAIWGFSQGACFAGMLMAMLSEKSTDPLDLRQYLPKEQRSPLAGVFFGGFKARFEQYRPLYEMGVQVPTLHVMGENDLLVSVERSEGLADICEGMEVLKHQNGHNLPKEKDQVEQIAEFLTKNVR